MTVVCVACSHHYSHILELQVSAALVSGGESLFLAMQDSLAFCELHVR